MQNFWQDANWVKQVEQSVQSTDVVPAGQYSALITDTTLKTTKDGLGQYILCTVEITGPTHDGRKIFHKIHVDNQNPKAVSISIETFYHICNAVGAKEYFDGLQAHATSTEAAIGYLSDIFSAIGNRPLSIKVAIKNDDSYGDYNVIKRWSVNDAKVDSIQF